MRKTKADLERDLADCKDQGQKVLAELVQTKKYLDQEKMNSHRLGIKVAELNNQIESLEDDFARLEIEHEIIRVGSVAVIRGE